MSLLGELNRIKSAKEDLRVAINNKGGNLSENDLIDNYANEVNNLPQGDGGFIAEIDGNTLVLTGNNLSINENTLIIGDINE